MSDYRRVYVIGDVHGHAEQLSEVYWTMLEDGMDLDQDVLVQLGDVVDRGPDSKTAVNLLMEWQDRHPDRVIVLRGNHEQLMLDALDDPSNFEAFSNWWYQGGLETFQSYSDTVPVERTALPKHVDEGHIAWIRNLPSHFECTQAIVVHAGLKPYYTPDTTEDHDKLWIREEFIKSPYDWGKPVIFGHTSYEKPLVMRNKVGIDTILKGGYLTGLVIREDGTHSFYHSSLIHG